MNYCNVNVLGLERPHPRKQLPAIFEIFPFRFLSADSSSSIGRPISFVLSLIGKSDDWSSTRRRQNTWQRRHWMRMLNVIEIEISSVLIDSDLRIAFHLVNDLMCPSKMITRSEIDILSRSGLILNRTKTYRIRIRKIIIWESDFESLTFLIQTKFMTVKTGPETRWKFTLAMVPLISVLIELQRLEDMKPSI